MPDPTASASQNPPLDGGPLYSASPLVEELTEVETFLSYQPETPDPVLARG